MDKAEIYKGGMPTASDVEALGIPKIDELITYERIEKIVGCSRKDNRFKTVIEAWRKRLLVKHNIHMVTRRGEGYLHANNSRRIQDAVDRTEKGKRVIGKAISIATATDKEGLTKEELRIQKHMADISGRLRLAAMTAPKEIEQ